MQAVGKGSRSYSCKSQQIILLWGDFLEVEQKRRLNQKLGYKNLVPYCTERTKSLETDR
jgi:hypothetical protein